LKPQIYKEGIDWILSIPGERLYNFESWQKAINFAMDPTSRKPENAAAAHAASTDS
jgi:hypothetical protein